MPSDAVLYQAAALCLTFPDDGFRTRLPLLREAAPQLREFTDHAAVTPDRVLAADYLRVFEGGHRDGLYLSRWSDGGAPSSQSPSDRVPERFEDAYRAHGLEVEDGELPDFLPAVLEFAARTGDVALLVEHRAGLERLRARLSGLGTPYACVLDAVCATLPPAPAGARP